MPDIGILVQSKHLFLKRHYFINELVARWAEHGLSVVVTDDIDQLKRVQLAILHYDQTRLPPEVSEASANGVPVLNGDLVDISKRRVSSHLVEPFSRHRGPVIVKTDRNCGGYPDLEVLQERCSLWRPAIWALRKLPWFISGVLDPGSYRIYDNISQVPWTVRHNKNLVIEEFLPERKDDFYCLRQYLFCGDREVNTLLLGRNPVVKAYDSIWREDVPDIPEALRDIRRAFGVDYGRFDYVLDGETVVLFDINRTPGYDPTRTAVPFAHMAETLAPGIWSFLKSDDNMTRDSTVISA